MSCLYLSLEQILDFHESVINRYGGTHGIRDRGLLESAIAQPRQSAFQTDIYPTLPEKAAALAFFISENQPFLDGNKRTAAVALVTFLRLNGVDLSASDDELCGAIMGLADKTWDRKAFFGWVAAKTSPPGRD